MTYHRTSVNATAEKAADSCMSLNSAQADLSSSMQAAVQDLHAQSVSGVEASKTHRGHEGGSSAGLVLSNALRDSTTRELDGLRLWLEQSHCEGQALRRTQRFSDPGLYPKS